MGKGYIHIYTGNGKGKTTAALGLAVRAVCAGKKVFFGQFVKGMKYNEVKCENYLPNIKFKQFGRRCFINEGPEKEDIDIAINGLKEIEAIILSKEYDVIIMDEITIALYFKLLNIEDVLKVLKNKPYETELILTGRYAQNELLDIADLITEMKEVKHYYYDGVLSRDGIDK
ncbi:cob(I)yrinic acid a,c-diamide adenosyltransferase [Clostridium sp. ATCC 25772]|uniref:cob(I)yrinic acid a,c-diamide adenosyltransferase n=1 Tax=Clostridium sp. ATCC 25772 TaxID=1676991 RepID=UPI0007827FEE|nr:cob(I)yrinic acid a,c-diamide adenosyltransferase [Clostridium sp. ATCC 25772]